MGATLFPRSLASRPPAAALPRACASSTIRINPACVAKPTAAAAASKKPTWPGPPGHGESPEKRARGVCREVDPDAATADGIRKRPRPSPVGGEEDPLSRSLCHGVEALRLTKNQAGATPTQAPPMPPACSMRELLDKARLAKNPTSGSPPKPPACTCSMRQHLEKARPAAADADAIHRREIERRRAQARREMELVVQTVEFNDPFIDPLDVLK